MDNVRIQQGDIYRISDNEYRVFLMTNDYVAVISMTETVIKKYDSVKFIQMVRSDEIIKCDVKQEMLSTDISKEELQKIQGMASVMDEVLQELYPEWEILTEPRKKKKMIRDAADNLGITQRYFSRRMLIYLRSGRNVYSLVDGRHFRNIKKETKKIQNPLQDNRPSQEVVSKQTLAYEDGLQEFKRILKVQGAYDYVITKYYSEMKCEMNNGVLEEVIVPNADAPSYSSFYRYVASHLGGRTVKQYINGERETRNNDRFLTGNQRSGMITIGQYMQVDECEVAVNLVSDDGTQIIGKPIMYCAFEPVAQIIIGAYIGLINNSMGGFNNLLLSMLEPHNNQTEPYGVTCTDENFPSMVIPKNFYSDQGSEYMSGHMEQAMLELGIAQSIVPAAAGSYKGGVENCFHRLQARLKTLLINDGYILETHDGAKNARSNACLTMHDFKTIVYRLIIEINTTSLGKNYSPDADMIENHVPAVPSEIWKHKMKTCYDPISVTDSNKMQIMFALLWRDKRFDIGRDGLTYHSHNLRYFVDEPWFIELLKEKTPVFDVRYDDTDVSCIYVRYKKQIHKVPLAISRDELRSYVGLTWGAYDELFKQHKVLMKEQKRKDAQVRLTTAHQNKKTRDAAKVLHDGIVNDKKEIKENRATQRAMLENDENELRNRLLEKDTLSSVPEDAVSSEPEKKSHTPHIMTMDEMVALFEDPD